MATPSPVQGSPPATHSTSRPELAPPLVSATQYYQQHHSSPVARTASSSTPGSHSELELVSAPASASDLEDADRSGRRCFRLPYSLLSPAAQSILWPTDAIYLRYRELPTARQALGSDGAKDPHHKPKPKPQASYEITRTHQGRTNTLGCGTCVVDNFFFFLVQYVYIGMFLYHFVTLGLIYHCLRAEFHRGSEWRYALVAIALAIPGLEYWSQRKFGVTQNEPIWRIAKFIRRQRAQWRADNGLDRTSPAVADEEPKHTHLRSYITRRNLLAEPPSDPMDDFFNYFAGAVKRFLCPAEQPPKYRYRKLHQRELRNTSALFGVFFDRCHFFVRIGREPNVTSSHPASRLGLSWNLRAQAEQDGRKVDLLVNEYLRLLEEGKLKPGNKHDSSIRGSNFDYEEFIQAGDDGDEAFFVKFKDIFDGLDKDFTSGTAETLNSSNSSGTKSDEGSDDSGDSNPDPVGSYSDDSDSEEPSEDDSDRSEEEAKDGSDDSNEEFHDATNDGSEADSNESWPVPKTEDGSSTGLDNGVDDKDESRANEDWKTEFEATEDRETNEERPRSHSDGPVDCDGFGFEADDEEYVLIDSHEVLAQHEQLAETRLHRLWPRFRRIIA